MVHQTYDFFMIPELYIGGSKQLESEDGMIVELTNGYMIQKLTNNESDNLKFMDLALKYFVEFGLDRAYS